MRESVDCEAGEAALRHYIAAEDGDGLGAVGDGVQKGQLGELGVGEAFEQGAGVGGAVEGEVGYCWFCGEGWRGGR